MRLHQLRNPEEFNSDKKVYLIRPTKNLKTLCGHSIDPERIPNTGCNTCWSTWFVHNQDFTMTIMSMRNQGKSEELRAKFGKKLVKKLEWFFTEVQRAKEIHDELDHKTTEALSKPEEFDIVFHADGRQEILPVGAPSTAPMRQNAAEYQKEIAGREALLATAENPELPTDDEFNSEIAGFDSTPAPLPEQLKPVSFASLNTLTSYESLRQLHLTRRRAV